MNRKRPFNGSPTVDGYYTTFDSSEVHRLESSDDDTGKLRSIPITFINLIDEYITVQGAFLLDAESADDIDALLLATTVAPEDTTVLNAAIYGDATEIYITPDTEGAGVAEHEGDIEQDEGDSTHFIIYRPVSPVKITIDILE